MVVFYTHTKCDAYLIVLQVNSDFHRWLSYVVLKVKHRSQFQRNFNLYGHVTFQPTFASYSMALTPRPHIQHLSTGAAATAPSLLCFYFNLLLPLDHQFAGPNCTTTSKIITCAASIFTSAACDVKSSPVRFTLHIRTDSLESDGCWH